MRFIVFLLRAAHLRAPLLLERAFIGAGNRLGYSPVWRTIASFLRIRINELEKMATEKRLQFKS